MSICDFYHHFCIYDLFEYLSTGVLLVLTSTFRNTVSVPSLHRCMNHDGVYVSFGTRCGTGPVQVETPLLLSTTLFSFLVTEWWTKTTILSLLFYYFTRKMEGQTSNGPVFSLSLQTEEVKVGNPLRNCCFSYIMFIQFDYCVPKRRTF